MYRMHDTKQDMGDSGFQGLKQDIPAQMFITHSKTI